MSESVEHLVHVINKDDLHPSQEKLSAKAYNITKLKSLLELLTNYAKILRNRVNILSPFYKLLKNMK